MKKLIYALSLIIGLNAYSYEISEETAIAKLEEFFYLLDVDRYEKDDFFKVTTEDFQIFEDGLDLDRETFHEFIEEATGSIVETDWTLSDFKVTLGTDSAHISYYNNGIFILLSSGSTSQSNGGCRLIALLIHPIEAAP